MIGLNLVRTTAGAGQTFLVLSDITDLHLHAAAGYPTVPDKFTFLISAGVTVGQTSGAAAVNVGQFPSGSVVVIVNKGSVLAKGGAGSGVAGGDAIKADYLNQTCYLLNSGLIYAGGGSGGKGGNGGGGYYQSWGAYEYARNNTDKTSKTSGDSYPTHTLYHGANVAGNGNYSVGSLRESYQVSTGGSNGYANIAGYEVRPLNTYYTSGGAGGFAGLGQGFTQANTSGSAGSAGGTNAGAGGAGGAGGAWATAGVSGGNGASGNNGAGAAGSPLGAAGLAVVKSAATFTLLSNTGTILGIIT